MKRFSRSLKYVYLGLMLLFLYLPILYLIVFSFNDFSVGRRISYANLGRWNGFSDALMYLKSSKAEKYWPIQLLLYNIIKNSTQSGEIATQEGFFSAGVSKTIQMASVMFATVPILLVYPFMQRFFVKGIMLGAVKG